MSTTTGCPIPGASQPKEPVRLIDIKEILQYDGAHFTWSGGKNCLAEQKAAYARGYDAGMKFIVDEAKKAPTIDPESLRPTAHWISVKDRLPAKHECVLIYDSVCHNIYMAWRDDDLDVWFSEEYLPDFVYVTHWMPLPKPPEVTQ
jgi:hypothetical protein